MYSVCAPSTRLTVDLLLNPPLQVIADVYETNDTRAVQDYILLGRQPVSDDWENKYLFFSFRFFRFFSWFVS